MINLYVGKKMFSSDQYLLIESSDRELYIQLNRIEEIQFPGGEIKDKDIVKLINFFKKYIEEKDKDIENEIPNN